MSQFVPSNCCLYQNTGCCKEVTLLSSADKTTHTHTQSEASSPLRVIQALQGNSILQRAKLSWMTCRMKGDSGTSFQNCDPCLKNRWKNSIQRLQLEVNLCRYTPHVRRGKYGLSSTIFSEGKASFKMYSSHRVQPRAHLLPNDRAIHMCNEYYKKQGNL